MNCKHVVPRLTGLVVALCCLEARILLQSQDFDLILGVQPTGHLPYGGRHITIAKVTASSREAAAAAVKPCNERLIDSAKARVLGWSMRGPPANCLGHMDAGISYCKDKNPWDLKNDGYPLTPTIAIASQTLDGYAECLAKKTGGGVTISLKGPRYSKNNTVWHSALYGSSSSGAQAEFDAFVSSKAKWVPWLNGRHISSPDCPATLMPKEEPGPAGNRCWHWTAVV